MHLSDRKRIFCSCDFIDLFENPNYGIPDLTLVGIKRKFVVAIPFEMFICKFSLRNLEQITKELDGCQTEEDLKRFFDIV